MRVLVTGATGYLGGVIAERLRDAGHAVSATARSDGAAEALRGAGLVPVAAGLDDDVALADAVTATDAVVHAAFGRVGADDPASVGDVETRGVTAMLGASQGRPFVYVSGIGVVGTTGAEPVGETDPVAPSSAMAWRRALERATLDAGGCVVRPGLVHGHGGGFVLTALIEAAHAAGASRYLRPGDTAWPTVHVDDVATLVVATLARPGGAGVLHAVGESTTPRAVATAIGRLVGVPVEGLGAERADEVPFGQWPTTNQVIGTARTRERLGWTPSGTPIEQDLADGSYRVPRSP